MVFSQGHFYVRNCNSYVEKYVAVPIVKCEFSAMYCAEENPGVK